MKIVTDGDKFGIQTGWFFKKYIDLSCPSFSWDCSSRFYSDCWSTKEKAISVFNTLNKKRTIRIVSQEELNDPNITR